jgi:hypothetical protein
MAEDEVEINRAPVLTLWAAVVAERQGYDRKAALTFGKAVAGLNAQAKGRNLGIYSVPKPAEGGKAPKKVGLGEDFWVQVCGRPVPAKNTREGIRAVVLDKPIDPAAVQKYLETKFGASLPAVRKALHDLAASYSPEELGETAFSLYEQFRPEVPRGKKGWGQAGTLSLKRIQSLAKRGGRTGAP